MKRFCFHAGLMLVFLSLVNQGIAVLDDDPENVTHVFCSGNSVCEARSAQPGDPGPADCTTNPEPCSYIGPNGDTCACDVVPGNNKQCRCFVN
jgi:hypothetical protein